MNRETFKKRTKQRIITIVVLVILALIILYAYSHSTHWKFNDWFVLNSSREEIIAWYGQPDFERGSLIGYETGSKDHGLGPMGGTGLPLYYWIEFDDSGYASQVYVALPMGG